MKIGFVGTGVIAEAIIVGLFRAEVPVERIYISRRGSEVSGRLAKRYEKVTVFDENQAIVDAADIVLLSVRPQIAKDVLSTLSVPQGKEVVSVIASVPIEVLADWMKTRASITRAVPLPAVAELKGVTAVYPESEAANAIFSPLGGVAVASTPSEFDSYAVAAAIMGTYFGILEGVSGWMERQAADQATAKKYISSVCYGLAATSEASTSSFTELRKGHTTPNGLNERAYESFVERGGLEALDGALSDTLKQIQQKGLFQTD